MVKRGFTIIELLIAASISTIVLGVTADASVQSWRSYVFSQAASQLQQEIRQTMDYATIAIESAATVATSTTINGTTYTTGAQTIVLRALPVDASGTILTGDDFTAIAVRSGNAAVTEAAVSAASGSIRANQPAVKVLTDLTSQLTFRYYDFAGNELVPGSDDLTATRSVSVTLTLSKPSGATTSQRTLESTFYLRNKTG